MGSAAAMLTMCIPHCVGCLHKTIYDSRSNARWRRALLRAHVLRLTGKPSNMIDQATATIFGIEILQTTVSKQPSHVLKLKHNCNNLMRAFSFNADNDDPDHDIVNCCCNVVPVQCTLAESLYRLKFREWEIHICIMMMLK